LVSTTALNCIAAYPSSAATSRTRWARARPTPLPAAVGDTMKPALAT
jgi:hypothetical protein